MRNYSVFRTLQVFHVFGETHLSSTESSDQVSMLGIAQGDPDAIRSGMAAVTPISGCLTPPPPRYPFPQGESASFPYLPGHRSRFGREVRSQQWVGIAVLVQQVLLRSTDYIIDYY